MEQTCGVYVGTCQCTGVQCLAATGVCPFDVAVGMV
jgi:hypothetical protein